MPPLIAIVGETASGKSALAMELAQKFNGEIICADSWTVYKGFDVGTAKPTAEERALVPHHLLDVADPQEGFSVVLFQGLALRAITDITSRGRLPILVGGTGLYIDSVLFNYSFLPARDPSLRNELNLKELDELLQLAHKRQLDTSKIDIRNKRRLIRLIENNGVMPTKQNLRENTLVLGLAVPRDALKQHVAKRVDRMLDLGLEQEVHELAARYGWEAEPMKGIGYREWHDYFTDGDGANLTLDDAGVVLSNTRMNGVSHMAALQDPGAPALTHDAVRQRIIKSTMDLAKRQRTWFKRNQSIQWVSDRSYAVDLVTTFLNNSTY
ncbi:MAG TPA: tRNA (adenosine(37)-N6)-dimethylallyltransferase MiaA [Candidatus Saccharimonadia bacterium]|nr:tRNA (adenosine(37)-N6)-dimethylallyltransferase MiaA [Candidatus Saccharimonadia bacterium]